MRKDKQWCCLFRDEQTNIHDKHHINYITIMTDDLVKHVIAKISKLSIHDFKILF